MSKRKREEAEGEQTEREAKGSGRRFSLLAGLLSVTMKSTACAP